MSEIEEDNLNININNINFDEWKIHIINGRKHIISKRTIYYNNKKQLFMKIWDKKYYYKNNFINAYKNGFYKDIVLLKNIIVDNEGDILGYITYKLNKIKNLKDKKNYTLFLDKLINNSKNLKLAHIDITFNNIGILNNEIYLFDLENVVTFDSLKKIKQKKWIHHNPKYYVNFLKKFLNIS